MITIGWKASSDLYNVVNEQRALHVCRYRLLPSARVRLQQRPRRQSVDRQDAAYVSPREVRRLLVWGPPGPRRLNKVPSHRPIIVGDVVGSLGSRPRRGEGSWAGWVSAA
jgi:hypothetical protein